MVPLDGDTGDAGILEGLQGFDGLGEGFRQDLADMEQVAADQNEIDPRVRASATMPARQRKKSS